MKGFVPLLPSEFECGIEIWNSLCVQPPLLDILRSRGISLVFIDHHTMDPLPKLAHRSDVFTAPFEHVRFLGNRIELEAAAKQAPEAGLRKRDFALFISYDQ
jgi:hypothetical protein